MVFRMEGEDKCHPPLIWSYGQWSKGNDYRLSPLVAHIDKRSIRGCWRR